MKFLLPAVVLCVSMISAHAQDSLVQRLGIHAVYHPYDFFAGVHYERQQTRFHHRFFVSTGIRTALQQRIYPQLGYQLGFDLLQQRVQAGPLVRANLSLLRFNRNADHGYLYDEELFAGGFVAVGATGKFRLSAGIGPALQQSWSPVKGRFAHYFSWNYIAEISWSYAL